MKVKIGFTVDPALLREIERQRGITKRSTFIEYLLKLGLAAYKRQQAANNKPNLEEPKL